MCLYIAYSETPNALTADTIRKSRLGEDVFTSPSVASMLEQCQVSGKGGKDTGKLRDVVNLLVAGQLLPREFNAHPLQDEWRPSRGLEPEMFSCL
jgi:hypothetical protein